MQLKKLWGLAPILRLRKLTQTLLMSYANFLPWRKQVSPKETQNTHLKSKLQIVVKHSQESSYKLWELPSRYTSHRQTQTHIGNLQKVLSKWKHKTTYIFFRSKTLVFIPAACHYNYHQNTITMNPLLLFIEFLPPQNLEIASLEGRLKREGGAVLPSARV